MPWQWYKRNQGRKVRLAAVVALALLSVLAAGEAYIGLADPERYSPQVRLGVPVVVLAVLVGAGLYLLNRPRVADFLIETQSELDKVSWPSKQQVLGSTGAVLLLVLMVGVYLYGVDWVVDLVFREVLHVFH